MSLRAFPRTVLALGWVSLLTDLSSEMIYPLLPVFLSSVLGVGAATLGLVEGSAEATASLLKMASGWWSDGLRRRKPLVLAGYSISGACRPLIGLATSWPGVLLLRLGDRVGKGLRTAPRDALIAEAVAPNQRGAAFGFHRAMDHAGAVLGPLAASGLLALGFSLRGVFLMAALPALAVVLSIHWGVREEPRPPARKADAPAVPLTAGFRRLCGAVVLFTLGNSTDAFLLLRLGEAGLGATGIAFLWSAHHVVKMTSTYLGGRLSDRLGRRPVMTAGWLFYAAVYGGFAVTRSVEGLAAVFLSYGIYYGLTEPVEKAWAADLSPQGLRGRAFGLYHGSVGLASLPASVLFGVLWKTFGSSTAFFTGAALALAAALLLFTVPATRPETPPATKPR